MGKVSEARQEHERVAFAQMLRALPGYPWLPCPICKGVEGCDHIVAERALTALPGLVLPPTRRAIEEGESKPPRSMGEG